jgi:phosphoglycolate phosphatase
VYKLAIFDFDGTMVDSIPGIERMLRRVTEEYALPISVFERWRQMIGLPLIDQVSVLLDNRDKQFQNEVVSRCRVLTDQMSPQSWPLFPGLLDCLEPLKSAGVAMAIVSAKQHHQIVEALEHHRLLPYFRLVIGAEDVTRHKPDPEALEKTLQSLSFEKKEAVVIGDSIYDLQMASKAGVDGIGVITGIHSKDQLMAAGAKSVVDSIKEIIPAILQGPLSVA